MEPLGLAGGPTCALRGVHQHPWLPPCLATCRTLPTLSPQLKFLRKFPNVPWGAKPLFKSLCGCPSPGREDVPSQAAPAPRPSTGARWHPVCVEGTGRQQARASKLRGSLSPSRQELLRRHGPGPRGPVPSSQPMAEAGQRSDAPRTTVQGRRRSAGVAGLRQWPRADTPARAPGQFCRLLTPSATG